MSALRCPTCKATLPPRAVKEVPTFPFCSSRCKLADLGSWLDGRYVVAEQTPQELEDMPSMEEFLAHVAANKRGNS